MRFDSSSMSADANDDSGGEAARALASSHAKSRPAPLLPSCLLLPARWFFTQYNERFRKGL
jgi:hypothetical protein